MSNRAANHTVFRTDVGYAAIAWGAAGVSSFRLPASSPAQAERALLRRLAGSTPAEPPAKVAQVIDAARRYFTGERVDFASVRIDLGPQEPFDLRIYNHVRRLSWGQTTTYGAVARELGEEREAARLVGRAMAANPVPLIVPCHRVMAAGGRIGGFSAPGGSHAKAHMLGLEGAVAPVPAEPEQIGFGF